MGRKKLYSWVLLPAFLGALTLSGCAWVNKSKRVSTYDHLDQRIERTQTYELDNFTTITAYGAKENDPLSAHKISIIQESPTKFIMLEDRAEDGFVYFPMNKRREDREIDKVILKEKDLISSYNLNNEGNLQIAYFTGMIINYPPGVKSIERQRFIKSATGIARDSLKSLIESINRKTIRSKEQQEIEEKFWMGTIEE